jgi:hypothetical protein
LPADKFLPSVKAVGTAEVELEETDDLEEKIGVDVDEAADSTDLADWNDVADGLSSIANRSSRRSTSHLHLTKYRAEYRNT